MTKTGITKDDAIQLLNELVEADKNCMEALIDKRVACNNVMADHPTAQVGIEDDGSYRLGLLGVLNGIFGADDTGRGFIGADYDKDDNFIEFIAI